MIAEMSKVEIIGPKRFFDPVLHVLQDIGELHIEEVPLGESEGKFLLHRMHIDETLEKEKGLLENLLKMLEDIFRLGGSKKGKDDIDPVEKEKVYETPLKEIYFRVTNLNNRLKSLVRRRRNIEDDLSVAKRYDKLVKRFLPVINTLNEDTPCEYLGITIPTKEKKTLEGLRIKMGQVIGEEYKFFSYAFEDGQTVALLAFEENCAADVKDLLWHEGISELRVPSEFESIPLDETLESLHKKLTDFPADLEKIHKEIENLILNNISFIQGARERCLDRLEHFKVFSDIALTEYTFIINAWVPSKAVGTSPWVSTKSVGEIRSFLDKKFGGAVLINELDVDEVEREDIPVKLENKPVVTPFELLLNFFPPPKYGTVDPTSLIALFFPIFFGMILGDIAYGLIVGLIGLLIMLKSKTGSIPRRVSMIFLLASLWTVVFGFIYGEFLGDLGESFGLHPLHPFFHREVAILPSLIMACSVGGVHILLGYILSMINSLREKNTHKVFEKVAELGGLFGLFFMVGSLARFLSPAFFVSGAGLLIIALIIMIYFHNFLAPLEIITAIGNILSYARIMAIGLSSVILAVVANRFSGMVGNVVVGVIIAGLLHALNIALGIFSPSIHSARLHYVEFFTKFYQAEGKKYLPFKRKGGDVV